MVKWWSELLSVFDGDPRVTESTDVAVLMMGNPDHAGFVQVIRGRSTDRRRMRDLRTPPDDFPSFRPDILGDVTCVTGDELITSIYFTAEDEARQNEKIEPPAQAQAMMDEAMKLAAGEPEWFDLSEPLLYPPAS
jgi:hypothetical protein